MFENDQFAILPGEALAVRIAVRSAAQVLQKSPQAYEHIVRMLTEFLMFIKHVKVAHSLDVHLSASRCTASESLLPRRGI